jgi:inner membrane protein
MPTIGHAAIGLAAARAETVDRRGLAARMLLYGALAAAPDLDLIATVLHHPMAVPLGHRGATHSLTVALVVAAVVAFAARGTSRLRTGWMAFAVVASHGLIDPLNESSSGTAYFWPFSSRRLTWGHFQPIPTTPVGPALLHGVGLTHLLTELVIFSPLLLYAFWPRRRSGVAMPREGDRWRNVAAVIQR